MKHDRFDKFNLLPAEKFGFVSLITAVIFFMFVPKFTVIPLALFLVLCITIPFVPQISFFMSVNSRGKTGEKAVAITFDDGPDLLTTPALLRLLAKHHIKATFFVLGKKADEHPELIKEIVSQGHLVGNHSYSHDKFLMLKSRSTLLNEVNATQEVLKGLGITPLAFRPPGGITTPRLGNVLKQLGLYGVNFSCRAVDGGNRWINNLSERILKRVRPDDIVVLHDSRPKKEALFEYWLNEIESILTEIQAKGFKILPLSELIEKPVMIRE